ncbi:class I SAM-dependent DNA methyltransferase [Nocardia arthritidis]|nr:class I SAM-dependent methyltransferase [Nocardia arthritidis]
MLTELMARAGQAALRGTPPNGKDYWAARFWDRESAERHPLLGDDFLLQKETIGAYLTRYGWDRRKSIEFACGTGEFTAMTAKLTAVERMVAVDISQQGLAIARSRVDHPSAEFIHGDFWADNAIGTADLVICVDAIHHLGDVGQVLSRIRSFLEPGGIFVGNLWTADNFHEFQRRRYGAAEHLARTAMFLGTALMIKCTNGRLRTGSYRTQLRRSEETVAILHDVFDAVLEVDTNRYFMSFVCRA